MPDAEEAPPVAAALFMLPSANLPPPKPLVVDDNMASNWKQWKKVWQRHEIAAGINKRSCSSVNAAIGHLRRCCDSR